MALDHWRSTWTIFVARRTLLQQSLIINVMPDSDEIVGYVGELAEASHMPNGAW